MNVYEWAAARWLGIDLETAERVMERNEKRVARVLYYCPVKGRTFEVGPADYSVYIPGHMREFEIEVRCLCGEKHILSMEE